MVKPAAHIPRDPAIDAVGEADLPTACLTALADLSALLRGQFASSGERYGIPSVAAFRLLTRLGQADQPLRPSVLAAEMHLTRGALTQMLQTLERRGLVRRERDPADQRVLGATLTAEGRESLAAFAPSTRRREIEICAVLDADAQRSLLSALTRLRLHTLGMAAPPGEERALETPA